MSTAENKLLIRRFIEEVVNTGNVDKLAGFVRVRFPARLRRSLDISERDRAESHVCVRSEP